MRLCPRVSHLQRLQDEAANVLAFLLTVVNAVSILPIMDVFRRQILFIKIDCSGFWSTFLVNGLVKLESIGFVYFAIAFIVIKVSKR